MMHIPDSNRSGVTITRYEDRVPMRLTRDGRCELTPIERTAGTQFGTRRTPRIVRDINVDND